MKKMSMLCAIFLLFGAGTALAQAPTYQFAEAGTKNFVSEITIDVDSQISLDIYLSNVGEPQQAGGVWIDFSASASNISYVSAGRAVTDGSEGVTGPWLPGVGTLVNEPAGPGTMIIQVANLGGAAPDGDGDLIVGNLTLQCTAAGDATVPLDVTDLIAIWTPISDADVVPGSILIHQGGPAGCVPEECDDGLFCNGTETCVDDVCTPGTAPDCDDGVPCTDDVCDTGLDACENIPNDGACDDDDLCTNDSCNPVTGCQNDPVICPPGEECVAGTCVTIPDCITNDDCIDGIACTEDLCVDGTCENIPNDGACDDDDLCTNDSCNPVTGCQNDPVICPPGEECVAGTCVTIPDCIINDDCIDGIACTDDFCVDGTCENIPNDGACDDDDLCTNDSCNPVTGCQNDPVICPPGEECVAGTCVTIPDCIINDDCIDGIACTDDFCVDGTCVNTPDDGACDDDDLCTNDSCDSVDGCQNDPVICPPGEECVAGTCVTIPDCITNDDCIDGIACTEDLCVDGTCENIPNDGACDDDDLCTNDSCNPLTGCQNDPVICLPGQECVAGECVTPPDCITNDDCIDGIACTDDFCVDGTCVNTPDDGACDDGVYCTDDTCDEVAGCRSTPNDENCEDDGLYCNGEELCDSVNDCYSTGDPCDAGENCDEENDICVAGDEEIVSIDIRPGVCPNPLDIKSEKMLPVAILGSKYFDVKTIDVDSIMITREGIEGGVAPANEGCYEEGIESVVPPTNEGCYKDVGTPFEGELCDCHDLDGDGYVDLTLKFDIQELVDVLMLDHVQGETIPLVITGEFETYKSAGNPISPPPIMMFAGMDCIEVLGYQEVCDNDIDDDYNGDVDCEDADCDGFVFETTECGIGVCSSTGEVICSYGEKVDTCEPGMPTEKPEATCNDGLDNDCDGLTDHGDPDCKTTPPLPVECTKDENCDDGVFCNGAETCLGGSCRPGSAPCTDDGAFCNGDETCDEKADKCVSSGDPCAPESECDELKDICLTEPLPCDITIEPKSPSVVSGQPLTFSIIATGDCDDPAYEWSIESEIGSEIDQDGNYVAGIHSDCLEDAVDIIEVMGKNTGAYFEIQVKVSCESKSNLAVYPNDLWSSRWIKVPALMFIVSEQGAFNLTSELTFEPVGNISPIWSLGFSNVMVAIVVVETNAQAGPYSVTVTTDSHVVTKQDAVEVFMLPLPLRNRK